MNYSRLMLSDMSNGPGVRVSLFVSGCNHHCLGCFSKETWKYDSGDEFTDIQLNDIITQLKSPYIQGLSILGGDPLMPRNRECVLDIVKKVKASCNKSIWLWTGFSFDEVKDLDIMAYIDTCIDGKYEKDLPPALYRGSSNQNIYQKQEDKTFIKIT